MWQLPPNNILKKSSPINEDEEMESAWREAGVIESRCEELGIGLNIEDIQIGPSTVQFCGAISEKTQVRMLGRLKPELEYALGIGSIGIEAPIAGRKFIGITTARSQRRMVCLGDVI
jgi:DNA segregation ATPase FtsK/SpoIIIE, S-DNA-T family